MLNVYEQSKLIDSEIKAEEFKIESQYNEINITKNVINNLNEHLTEETEKILQFKQSKTSIKNEIETIIKQLYESTNNIQTDNFSTGLQNVNSNERMEDDNNIADVSMMNCSLNEHRPLEVKETDVYTKLVELVKLRRCISILSLKGTNIGVMAYGVKGYIILYVNKQKRPIGFTHPERDVDVLYADLFNMENLDYIVSCTNDKIVIQCVPDRRFYQNFGGFPDEILGACLYHQKLYLFIKKTGIFTFDLPSRTKSTVRFMAEYSNEFIGMCAMENDRVILGLKKCIQKIDMNRVLIENEFHADNELACVKVSSDFYLVAFGQCYLYILDIKTLDVIKELKFEGDIVDVAFDNELLFLAFENRIIRISVKEREFDFCNATLITESRYPIKALSLFEKKFYVTTDSKIFYSNV